MLTIPRSLAQIQPSSGSRGTAISIAIGDRRDRPALTAATPNQSPVGENRNLSGS
ncbi:uncharacterized protein Dmoj_GI25563 [Drosophila mojavensis]|uniref:Uncharacterized protein n=1 Tax=Drosophila mojavensis TaxID=7230 RepID=A0A0Q9XFE5_DROMO|nr:uncharacterized protein Dmoj_GI25563 [Drosophila mojavensis]